jgi:hypothetical protein
LYVSQNLLLPGLEVRAALCRPLQHHLYYLHFPHVQSALRYPFSNNYLLLQLPHPLASSPNPSPPTCKPPHNHNDPCTLLGTRAMHVHGKRATLLSCALSCMFNPERSHIKRWSRHTPQLHTCSSVSISAWVDMRRLGSSTSPPSHESRIWALREGRFLMRTGSGDLVQFGGGASSLESRVDGPL